MRPHYNMSIIFGEIYMSTSQDDNESVVWAVLAAAVLLAVGVAVGVGISKSHKDAPAAPAAVTAPAAEASAPAAEASAAPAASEASAAK